MSDDVLGGVPTGNMSFEEWLAELAEIGNCSVEDLRERHSNGLESLFSSAATPREAADLLGTWGQVTEL